MRALASHQCGPGSNPGVDAIFGLSLLLVLSLVTKVFSGYSGFPLSSKTNISNSNSTRNQVYKEPLCECATFKSLCIYFSINFIDLEDISSFLFSVCVSNWKSLSFCFNGQYECAIGKVSQ